MANQGYRWTDSETLRLAEENARLNREIAEKPSPYFRGLAEGRREADGRIAALEEKNRKLLAALDGMAKILRSMDPVG